MHHAQHIQVEPIEHKGESRLALMFPFDKQLIARVRTLPNVRWSQSRKCWHIPADKAAVELLTTQLTDLVTLPDFLKPATRTRLSSTSSDKAGITTTSTAAQGRLWHKVDITPADEARRVQVSLTGGKLIVHVPYRQDDVAFLKTLAQSFWHKEHRCWVMKANMQNVEKLEQRFEHCMSDQIKALVENRNPVPSDKVKHVAFLNKCESDPTQFVVKCPPQAEAFDVIKRIPGRRFSKAENHWLIPADTKLVNSLAGSFSEIGVTLVANGQKLHQPLQRQDWNSRQKHLLKDADQDLKTLLHAYTDALIGMRYSWATVKNYTQSFRLFALHSGVQAVATQTANDIRNYCNTLAKRDIALSTLNQHINAIKFYYEKVLNQPRKVYDLNRPRKESKLPSVLSVGELRRLFAHITNLKHQCMVYMAYSAGLRVSEVCHLRISDIDSERMMVHISNSKGNKDRMVPLSKALLGMLRQYYQTYQPKHWLFEGQFCGEPYSVRSLQTIFQRAKEQAGIRKAASFHTLRHCYATHLLENGTDVRLIQELLGHNDIKTTLRYTHVSQQTIQKIRSPFDTLFEEKYGQNKGNMQI
jgi:site-specific recombinase XerD